MSGCVRYCNSLKSWQRPLLLYCLPRFLFCNVSLVWFMCVRFCSQMWSRKFPLISVCECSKENVPFCEACRLKWNCIRVVQVRHLAGTTIDRSPHLCDDKGSSAIRPVQLPAAAQSLQRNWKHSLQAADSIKNSLNAFKVGLNAGLLHKHEKLWLRSGAS